ncbi:MAG: hypothetical protein Q9167_000582 [Letrouitia subvulpina]
MTSKTKTRYDPVTLRENIVLLSMLTKEPSPPSENDLNAFKNAMIGSGERKLSIERECTLVNHLAFLAAITDDPLKVMAVAVEESAVSSSITIRLATNHGDIKQVRDGFCQLAKILEQTSTGSHPNVQLDMLFSAVVRLHRNRILSRLRSKHAKTSRLRLNPHRPPPILRLAQVFTLIAPHNIAEGQSLRLQAAQKISEELKILFVKLESKPTDRHLESILKCLDELPSQLELSSLLNSIPNSGSFSPQDASSLSSFVGKLRRYHIACAILVTAARQHRLFSVIRIATISPQSPQKIHLLTQPEISRPINRILQSQRSEKQLAVTLQPESPVNQMKFASALKKNSLRVHAEIQLLYFYERHPEIARPRVISSSKDACFLCNLFLNLHGGFFTSSTHGVLYDTWTLPDLKPTGLNDTAIRKIDGIIARFSHQLEGTIAQLSQAGTTRRKHPKESRVNLTMWPSSVTSLANKSIFERPPDDPALSSVAKNPWCQQPLIKNELNKLHPSDHDQGKAELNIYDDTIHDDTIFNVRNHTESNPTGGAKICAIPNEPNQSSPPSYQENFQLRDSRTISRASREPSPPSIITSSTTQYHSIDQSGQCQIRLSSHEPTHYLPTQEINLTIEFDESPRHAFNKGRDRNMSNYCVIIESFPATPKALEDLSIVDVENIGTTDDRRLLLKKDPMPAKYERTLCLRRKDQILRMTYISEA